MHTFFLTVRALHVLLGATWLGIALLTSFFLLPAINEAGQAAGPVMNGLLKRKIDAFISSIAGLTVLSGFWLYWRFTNGFDPAISATTGAMVFGVGGVLGLISLIVGGSVVARSMKRAVAAVNAGQTDEAARYRQRAGSAGRIVSFMLVIAIICMALGHYV